jgi:glutaredoxin
MSLPITVYGATHCEDTAATRLHLRSRGIDYEYVNIDHDPAAEQFVVFVNRGHRSTPTVVVGDGRSKLIMTEPTDSELDDLLAGRISVS